MKVGTEREGHDTFVVVDGKRVGEGMDELDANAVLGWLERGGLEGVQRELRELLDARSYEAGLYARRMSEAQEREREHVTKAQDAADAVGRERDRLRREVEALRDEMREWCHGLDTAVCHRAVLYGPTIDRLDAILRGES